MDVTLATRLNKDEIVETTEALIAGVQQGAEACDDLTLLAEVAQRAIDTSDDFREKRNYAKHLLTKLAMQL